MLEREVDQRLVAAVRRRRGLCYKMDGPIAGYPDRLVILPGGRVIFIELKRPGAKPRMLQKAVIRRLRDRGCEVRVIDSPDQIEEVLG